MASKSRTREITILEKEGTFTIFRSTSIEKKNYNFEGISSLRKVLSNQRARLLHVIKTKNPSSIYNLSKILKRDFKAVFSDIKLLERFGFIGIVSEKIGKKERHRPVIEVDTINIILKI